WLFAARLVFSIVLAGCATAPVSDDYRSRMQSTTRNVGEGGCVRFALEATARTNRARVQLNSSADRRRPLMVHLGQAAGEIGHRISPRPSFVAFQLSHGRDAVAGRSVCRGWPRDTAPVSPLP